VAKLRSPLDRFLTKRLEELDLTLRAFAQRVGVSHVFVIKVKQGQKLFPGEQFSRWCKALELNDEMRGIFMHVTIIAQCPSELRKYIAELETHRGSKPE
jgi:transcriptional regulator with XRE-family HTH domain